MSASLLYPFSVEKLMRREAMRSSELSDDRLLRETRSYSAFFILSFLLEVALPLGIGHSFGQPGTFLRLMWFVRFLQQCTSVSTTARTGSCMHDLEICFIQECHSVV